MRTQTILWLTGVVMTTLTVFSMDPKTFRDLTLEERQVVERKGTEAPYSGKYDTFKQEGTYICKRCGAPLYRSGDKFESRCGWPSFDDELSGAVRRQTDADGRRTEILCARCGAHLGHVFLGEGLTPKNTRHCVNSISMDFVSAAVTNPVQKAVFAGGCFWGVEYHFQHAKGVVATRVGYSGGRTSKPDYKQVCSGRTGHAEALEVTFDPSQTTYEDLARLFFEIHDPTQLNRQGPDRGEQYRSAVFYLNAEQKQIAEKLIGLLKDKGLAVATQLAPAGEFWPAEDYHQRYYERKGEEPYCHVRQKRF